MVTHIHNSPWKTRGMVTSCLHVLKNKWLLMNGVVGTEVALPSLIRANYLLCFPVLVLRITAYPREMPCDDQNLKNQSSVVDFLRAFLLMFHPVVGAAIGILAPRTDVIVVLTPRTVFLFDMPSHVVRSRRPLIRSIAIVAWNCHSKTLYQWSRSSRLRPLSRRWMQWHWCRRWCIYGYRSTY